MKKYIMWKLSDLSKWMVGLALMVTILIGCTQDIEEPMDQALVYQNENFGFSLEFPSAWEGRYSVLINDDTTSFYCKSIHDDMEHGGQLLRITRMTGELITDEDMKQASFMKKIILKGNGYTYVLSLPSDVQYPPDDDDLTKEYKEMAQDVNGIIESIELLGTQKPEAKNEGYKVVGSSFFTAEIPQNWEMVPSSPLHWSIEEDSKHLGYIQFISYADERLDPEMDSVYWTLLKDETSRRAVEILLTKKTAQDMMKKIESSFQIQGGPYNVVDMQTAADTYVSQGGQMIYGYINGFEIVDGTLTDIRIDAMDFLIGDPDDPDTPDGKFPNGFELVPLGQYTYPVGDMGVSVIPLVGPNYTNYGTYDMIMVDENFIQHFEEDYDRFYQFYIGADGVIKILIMNYLP